MISNAQHLLLAQVKNGAFIYAPDIPNAYQWKLALPGFFTKYNVSPVAEVEQAVPVLAKMMRKFKK